VPLKCKKELTFSALICTPDIKKIVQQVSGGQIIQNIAQNLFFLVAGKDKLEK
jgi:hypothetical protein